jgi:hypothetical protein
MDRVSLVLRVTSLKDFATAIDQALWLDSKRYRALGKLGLGVGSRVNIALSPRVNGCVAAGQDGRAVENSDRCGDVTQLDVVENKRPCKRAIGGIRVTNEDGCVFYYGVDDRF